jgi:hypothetical protein
LGRLIDGNVTRRIGQTVFSLPLLLWLSCGAVPNSVAQGGHAAPASAAPCPKTTPISFDGLTEEQKSRLLESMEVEAWRCYAVWVASLNPTTIQYATLGHTGLDASCPGPDGSSLSEAKANASLVISGTVKALSPQATAFGTKVTIAVTTTFKGQAANTIVVHQMSHLEPIDNWRNIIVVDAANAPLLLPGESVFLFLKSGGNGLYQMSFTGTYYVRNGRMQALDWNPFASKANGLRPADFGTAIAAA